MNQQIVSVHISGLDELERKLYDLPTKYAKRVMRRALHAADLWKDEMVVRAHRLTGWMASQCMVSIRLSAREDAGTAMVGFTKKQNPGRHDKHVPSAANEAFWMELGTVKQPAQPFMRPSYDAKGSAVLAKFTEVAKEELAHFDQ